MSPIRPEELGRYPKHWPTICMEIADRAGGRCECEGECGQDHDGRCHARHGQPLTERWPVVLTVAHLDHTPENCVPANLRAMCQPCHLRYDRDHHRETAARTRRRRRTESGQLALEVPDA